MSRLARVVVKISRPLYLLPHVGLASRIQMVLRHWRERGLTPVVQRELLMALKHGVVVVLIVLSSPLALVLWAARVRFLPAFVWQIGSLAYFIDTYLKEGLLGWRSRYRTVLWASRIAVANNCLLDYWAPHLKVVHSPLLSLALLPLASNRLLQYNVFHYDSQHPQPRSALIQAEYERQGGQPLLTLKDADRQRGWETLRQLGVPEGAWFVCVHARESGFEYDAGRPMRNVDILTYLPALRHIVERGGWVVRMGNPLMTPLPPLDGVIDYAHSAVRSEWMDVFLCATCRFFLGCNSGLNAAPSVFGAPVAVANYMPVSGMLFLGSRPNRGVPKLLWSRAEERYLTFEEIFSTEIANFNQPELYEKAGLEIVSNTPDEIVGLVQEMLELVEGTLRYTDEDERRQARLQALLRANHYSYGSSSRVGRDFLRKYAHLLGLIEVAR